MEKEQIEHYVEQVMGPDKLQIVYLTKRVQFLGDRLRRIEEHLGLQHFGQDPPPTDAPRKS